MHYDPEGTLWLPAPEDAVGARHLWICSQWGLLSNDGVKREEPAADARQRVKLLPSKPFWFPPNKPTSHSPEVSSSWQSLQFWDIWTVLRKIAGAGQRPDTFLEVRSSTELFSGDGGMPSMAPQRKENSSTTGDTGTTGDRRSSHQCKLAITNRAVERPWSPWRSMEGRVREMDGKGAA